jgi:hypothetical protein
MESLEDLARKKFPFLHEAEIRVLQSAPDGTTADCRDLGGDVEPEKAYTWPLTRTVRADLIRWLCVDHQSREQVDPRGIQICGARIAGALDLSFTIVPFPLLLRSCRLEQNLTLRWAKMPALSLEGSWTAAIDADGIKLEALFLRNGFHAEGDVRLLEATIGGDLDAEGGTLKNLGADGIKVTGRVSLRNGFSSEGEVRFCGATIGGHLDAGGGTFKNTSALNADHIEVSGDVFLTHGFVAVGLVWLREAEVRGQLAVEDAWLDELMLQSARITGTFFWRNIHKDRHPDFPKEWKPSLNLGDAKVGALLDQETSWPEKGQLRLDGFVYDRIAEAPTDANTRRKWLRLQPDELGFRPQPYKQLAKVLNEMGHDPDAKRVLVEMEDARRKGGKPHWWSKSPNLSWPSWVWAWLLKITIGSGYLPFRAGWWVAAFVLVGFFLFSWGQDAGVLTPIQDNGIVAVQSKGGTGIQDDEVSVYQPFNGFIYSLETFLPLVDLQFAKHWLPCASCKPKCQVDLLTHLRHWPFRWMSPWQHDFGEHFGKHLRWYFWLHILAGWFFTTMFVAGVTGLVRKE